MADDTIFFTTSSTSLATATAKDIFYNECTELSARAGRKSIQQWRVNHTATAGSVEIDEGTAAYEVFLKPNAVIQSHRIPEGVAVVFRPNDVIKVVSLDEDHSPQELKVLYQHTGTGAV
jgi:hypothetical protein